MTIETKFPLPPFTEKTAKEKVQLAEDAWNSQNPEKVSMAYSIDTVWRNKAEFINGREEVVAFLTKKWQQELNYKLKKDLWAFSDYRIAVRFEYEFQNDLGQWLRAYGNENWEFNENGLMKERYASINYVSIDVTERKL